MLISELLSLSFSSSSRFLSFPPFLPFSFSPSLFPFPSAFRLHHITQRDSYNEPFRRRKVYLRHLVVDELHAVLTSVPSDPMRYMEVARLRQFMGLPLIGVQRADITLDPLQLHFFFHDAEGILSLATLHYQMEFLSGLYKLLGHSDLLANPVGLISSFGKGGMDFVNATAVGFRTGQIGKGFAKGTAHLGRNLAGGIAETTGKLIGNIGDGIAVLSLDSRYRSGRRDVPTGTRDGISQGVRQLGKGVLDGVTGVVRKPIRGARKDGLKGFVQGVGRGILGLPTKPIVGVLDLVSKTLRGIERDAKKVDDVKPLRPELLQDSSSTVVSNSSFLPSPPSSSQ